MNRSQYFKLFPLLFLFVGGIFAQETETKVPKIFISDEPLARPINPFL